MKSTAFQYLNLSESIQEYNERFYVVTTSAPEELTSHQLEMKEYYTLNWARSSRVQKTYAISSSGLEKIQNMKNPQYWFVITEGWCGDSSQSLPVMAAIANHSNGSIDLRIVSRDAHPALLEQYLTNGSMSIPKLIATSFDGEELWQWGPRPKPASDLFNSMKQQHKEKEDIYKALHAWYAGNKGQAIEEELLQHII